MNNLIKDDFIVISGDIITNIDIQNALKMHYHIKSEESIKLNQNLDSRKLKTIMTKLFLKMSYSNPVRDPSLDITLMIDR